MIHLNVRVPLLAFCLLTLPLALAHAPHGPNAACEPAETVHHYAGVSETPVSSTVGLLDGSLDDCDGDGVPGSDGEREFGRGGAFLAASHHDATVCVDDAALGALTAFVVGADLNGDGVVAAPADGETPPVNGCVTASFGAGADGGWWVFIVGPATAGDVW